MNKTLVIYPGFIASCLLVAAVFITATTYTQLGAATILYPILIFFAYKIFMSQTQRGFTIKKPIIVSPPTVTIEQNKTQTGSIGIADIDKRAFLKLIGGAGLLFFLFSFLNKKDDGLFSKSAPIQDKFSLTNPSGNKVDPAQNQATDGYQISEVDDDVVAFYGFTNKESSWFIMKGDNDTGSFRYTKGASNFPDNWNSRKHLKYDYFYKVFP